MKNKIGSCGSVCLLFSQFKIDCRTLLDNFCRVEDALQWKHLVRTSCINTIFVTIFMVHKMLIVYIIWDYIGAVDNWSPSVTLFDIVSACNHQHVEWMIMQMAIILFS